MATSNSGRDTSNQYHGLRPGSTSDLPAPELTDEQEHMDEDIDSPVQWSSEEQARMSDGQTIAMDQSCAQVDDEKTNEDCEEVPSMSHEIIIDSHNSTEMHLGNNASTNLHGTAAAATTNAASSGDQYITSYDYVLRFLANLAHFAEQLKPILIRRGIPCAEAENLLQTPQVPFSAESKASLQKALESMVDILAEGSDFLHRWHQMEHAFPTGEQTKERVEPRIAAPTEPAEQQLNTQLQVSTAPKLAPVADSQALTSEVLAITLSQLLTRAQHVVNELDAVGLKITRQPKQFWKKRYITCLKNKSCPAVQGRSERQRDYILIEWSKIPGISAEDLFVFVQLLSHVGQPHSTKVLVPPFTEVKSRNVGSKNRNGIKVRPTLDDLIISDGYGFDKNARSILYSVTDKEYSKCEKNLKAIMFNLYQTSDETTSTDHTYDAAEANEQEDMSIESLLNKLCKIRISLCRRLATNDLEHVSNFVVTDLIEESKGIMLLKINKSDVTPQQLCECGNEIITVTLITDSEKHGFVVYLDGARLDDSAIRGVKDKQISFSSRTRQVPQQNSLHIRVCKESIVKTVEQNHDPYNGLDVDELLDMHIPYVSHSDSRHACKST